MKTPLPYQYDTIEAIDKFKGRALVALDPGLGKTLVSLRWLHAQSLPALVICQANVKYTWEAEAVDVGLTVFVCEGQTPPKTKDFFANAQVIIVNYDILRFWVPYLQSLPIRTVIIDECQNFANPETKRTKAGKEIVRGKPFVLALSGTPLLNRPSELFPTLQMIWPKYYTSFWSFAQDYCNPRWNPRRGWDYTGSSNLDKLHAELLRLGMIRLRQVDVLKDLPPLFRQVVACQLSDYDEYRQATDDFMNWLKKNMGHRVRRAARVEKMAAVGYQLRLIARLKFRAAVEWANDFLAQSDDKLLLFAVHQKMINALERRLAAKSVRIDGTVVGRAREAAKQQFQTDPDTRVCLASIAGTTGVTLTAANTIGFTELYWRPGDHSQAEKRPHRIGQLNTVWANYLIATGTIEERLCQLLQKKQSTISTVLDGGMMDGDLNLYDELLTVLETEIEGGGRGFDI